MTVYTSIRRITEMSEDIKLVDKYELGANSSPILDETLEDTESMEEMASTHIGYWNGQKFSAGAVVCEREGSFRRKYVCFNGAWHRRGVC